MVDRLISDSGKTGPEIQAKIERKVGEVALEMLQQSGGRFRTLSRTQEISINTTDLQYKLNSDFFTARTSCAEYDSSGNFVRLIYIVGKTEVLHTIENNAPAAANMCYIEFNHDGSDGRGNYLVLADEASTSCTYKFEYYREPTENDIDAIEEWSLLMRGVRASLPEFFTTAEVDAHIYLRKLGHYQEDIGRVLTDVRMVPDQRTSKRNRLSHKIGRGH